MEIEYLEKAIGRKLELLSIDEIRNKRKIGYSLNENENIIALGLFGVTLKDYSFLKELKNLTTLNLSSNQISDISFLKELKYMTTLNLRSNQISDISFLKELKNLARLELESNQISDISFLEELKNLTWLDLDSNQISDYSIIKELTKLTTLFLGSNKISDISFLKDLKNLTLLYLGSNQISDISDLKELKDMTTLYLHSNQISDISYLKELKNLKTLDLSYNPQVSDYSFLKELKNLTKLYLGSNQISEIPNEITQLKSLRTLDISDNKISKLNPALLELDLEIFWENNFYGKTGLNTFGNPLETPPAEIVKKGKNAVKAYFKSLEEGEKQPLNEVKVLLMGDGGSGKTSLVKQLIGETFDKNEPQTQGINIKQWEIKDNSSKIKVHLWDFGGQEIMHATHQFFLSKRSLYVLVLDGRKEEEPEYWLKYIESFGGNSPVLIAINKIDDNSSFDVNRPFLQKKYKGIAGFYPISCANGKGIHDFRDSLTRELLKVELVRSSFAKTWFNVKDKLENMKENFLSCNEYIDMCKNENINEKISQDTLVEFLNDLGLILHFKDFELEDTYILEPKWVTNAVYKIINSEKLSKNNGVFKLSQLKNILKKNVETDFSYPRDKHRYIIDLMKKFELCYVIDSDTILIPDLLEIKEPIFDFPVDDSLRFIFEYDFLPRSVMPRFVVRMHKDIKYGLRWRTGVVLEDKKVYNSTALIKADERDKKIFIYVNGEQKRNYFSLIRKTIRDINSSFQKLEVEELVPLPDNVSFTVKYSALAGHEEMGERDIIIGELKKKYSVKKLLDGIEDEKERKEKYGERTMGRTGDIIFKPHIEVKPDIKVVSEVNVETNIDVNIKVDLPQIKSDFDELKRIFDKANPEPEIKKEMKEIQDSFDKVSPKSKEEVLNDPINKLGRFLKNLNDENSNINKIIKGTQKGIELAQKVGRTYNKFAQMLALPNVPPLLLGKDKE